MKPIRHMVLGRFAPIHNGHILLIKTMLEKYGSENCGIIIGSSNLKVNPRTPFSFEVRKKFITQLFPTVKIWNIPDIEEDLQIQREETLEIWQKKLKEMEDNYHETWIFCGGSQEDIKDLQKDFDTEIIINRSIEGEKISGTYIRKLLSEKNFVEVEPYLPTTISQDIFKEYQKFQNFFNLA